MAVSVQLAVQGIVALLTGVVYAYVARIVLGRSTSAEAHRANLAFAVWWGAFGAVEFLAGAYNIPAAFGLRDLALAVTLINLLLVLIAVALAGLVYFLVYLYTGSQRLFWPIAGSYGALAVAFLYLIAWMQPVGFATTGAPGALEYTRELEGARAVAFGLVLTVPVLIGALGYGSLYFRTDGRPQRFRIAIVAGSFLGWFGWSTVSTALQLAQRFPGSRTLLFVNSAVSLLVPGLIVLAYRPPAWLRERLSSLPRAAI